MQVGLFFGSFNPIHVGHMVLANYMLSFTSLDEVWLVVSPHNPLKVKSSLLNQNDRLHLVNLALDQHPKIKSSNIEFGLSQPSYTIHTLVHLKEKFPKYKFSLIMGQDNLQGFNKWKNYEEILKNYNVYVYPRPNCVASPFDDHKSVQITQAPRMDVSSTFIRKAIKEKKDVRFFMHPDVWNYIDEMNFYKK
ncbi:MAG: nicotinate (nicotinamide) nucleotide adenylyltransferase [Bacteroidota bacterium]|nr:nicotinate (nicotinamide) nucleotide adenylyltransferase [Bacteroidota bacterium]